MSFIYTQADLKNSINGRIQGKIGILQNAQDTMNAAVRQFYGKVDLRSAKKKSTLSPNLFNGIFQYASPSDLKDHSIIDLPAQAKRYDGEWELTTPEEFSRLEGTKTGLMAIDDYNGIKTLLLASAVDSQSLIISELDSLTSGGGTWSSFGDAENLAADTSDYVKGAGSIKFGINAAAGTTAGIVNSSVNSVDITEYLGGTSAFFVWVKINSTTNLTNFILRFGSDSSNYYSKTVTTKADGTAFTTGWNLLKFDVSSLTETGSVDDTALDYFAIYMTKTSAKVSETDYKFDWLVLKKGVVHSVHYYTKYGWQSSAGAYKENSTLVDDLLVADTDEYELIVNEGVIQAKKEIGFPDSEIKSEQNDQKEAIKEYLLRNPSESKIMGYQSYNY